MDPHTFFAWLEQTPFATVVRENGVLFPWIESVHVLAVTFVVGSISVVDLRLLGLASRAREVRSLLSEVLPFTWTAFGIALLTGASLFASDAVEYSENPPFRLKLLLMGLAALNMLVFHLITSRGLRTWNASQYPPLPARMAGAVSLLLWISIVTCGRWIGFTTGH